MICMAFVFNVATVITSTAQAFKTLVNLDGAEGSYPSSGLVQATNRNFYGTTSGGRAHSFGNVFSLSMGLCPFVEAESTFGKVGENVIIVGNNLTDTTSVSFNVTAAKSAVVSASEIKDSDLRHYRRDDTRRYAQENVVFRVHATRSLILVRHSGLGSRLAGRLFSCDKVWFESEAHWHFSTQVIGVGNPIRGRFRRRAKSARGKLYPQVAGLEAKPLCHFLFGPDHRSWLQIDDREKTFEANLL